MKTNNTEFVEKFFFSCLSKEFENLGIKTQIIKSYGNTFFTPTIERCRISLESEGQVFNDLSHYQVQKIDLSTWRFSVNTNLVLSELLIPTIIRKLKKECTIPIIYLDSPNAIIADGGIWYDQSSCDLKFDFICNFGIGIPKHLKGKNCDKCPKRLRCELINECTLKDLLK